MISKTPPKNTIGTDGSSCEVTGRVVFVEVELASNNELSFIDDSVARNRFFFVGFDSLHWPNTEEVKSGSNIFTRKHIEIFDEPRMAVYRGSTQFDGTKSAWLAYDDCDADTWSLDDRCKVFQNVASFLAGDYLPFLWRDQIADESVSRTYFGSQRQSLPLPSATRPLPISGMNGFKHAHKVYELIPGLFAEASRLSTRLNIGWIVGPLWQARYGFTDDMLALACVALERLATAFDDIEVHCGVKAQQKFWLPSQSKRIRKALKASLEEVAGNITNEQTRILMERIDNLELDLSELECDAIDERILTALKASLGEVAGDITDEQIEILKARIDQLGQYTNADKLTRVFEFLRLELSKLEVDTVQKRNDCFHGRPTMEGSSVADLDGEYVRFDILRMLIHKAVLGLLGYEGPYVAYSRRVGSNYPVENLVLARKPNVR